MAYTVAASDADSSALDAQGILRRLFSAIMRAREAQAQYRIKSQLRDLPDNVLQDIGLQKKEIHRLRNGRLPIILHMG